MLYALDLAGTFVFALSGAVRAVRHDLDLLGMFVLATLTGIGGGLIRDALLGATPAAAFQDEAYFLVCLLGGVAVFFGGRYIQQGWNVVRVLDAIGLGVFAGIGAAKAIAFGLGPIGVLIMAALTATGGGVVRDVLVREVPAVISTDFYATAALLGGAAFLGAYALGVNEALQLTSATIVTSGLRFYAMRKKLRLPKARIGHITGQ
ncbi:MAG: trimeric intracellular cation channel family protein [Rhodothermales bacterium]